MPDRKKTDEKRNAERTQSPAEEVLVHKGKPGSPETRAPEVSIVIACYNAEKFLEDSVAQIRMVMDATVFPYELIFVDDKSADRTAAIIRRLIAGHENCFLVQHRTNHGRGKTVHDGIKRARGEIVGFIDIDLDNPARYIFSMILGIRNGHADVCTAYRIYQRRIGLYFIVRMILSRGYARLSSLVLGTGLKDTETGCKFFLRKKIIPVLNEVENRGWFWDTEIMTRAYYHGLKIIEIPTLFIRNTRVTTVRLLPETIRYLASLLRFIPVTNRLRRLRLAAEKSSRIY